MTRSSHAAEFAHFIHKYFIWIIVASYVAAAFLPQFGLWIRAINFAELFSLQNPVSLTLPPVLLAALLFNAGLGVPLHELSALRRTPHKAFVMLAGLIGNVAAPLTMIAAISVAMMLWHDPDEVQQLLVGLALVAAMPMPKVVSLPDADFLAAVLVIVSVLCVAGFGSGLLLSRAFKTTPDETASLMFALGMNNNGTGLVLASLALANHPQVMLPIIFYNLVQHLFASIVDLKLARFRTMRFS